MQHHNFAKVSSQNVSNEMIDGAFGKFLDKKTLREHKYYRTLFLLT